MIPTSSAARKDQLPKERHEVSDRDKRVHQHGRSALISDIGGSLTSKHGGVFVLCGEDGDIDQERNPGFGLYFHDTRYLKQDRLRLAGARPSILLSHADGGESVSELTNPEIRLDDDRTLSKDIISIRRHRQLGHQVRETITVTNYGQHAVSLPMELSFDAGFENMFTVRGADEGERGTLHAPEWHGKHLAFRYDGADHHVRTTTVAFDPGPHQTSDRAAIFELSLKPGDHVEIVVTVDIEDRAMSAPHRQVGGALEHKPTNLRSADAPTWARVESSNPLFVRTIRRSLRDLEMLTMRERNEVFFAAGVPWYVALFGRDSIITALETLAYEPRIAANTLELLARYQGTREDEWREEEPGKILHELRVGEKANLDEVPQTPYYGTVDATPLFIILLAEYVRWTADLTLWRRLRANVDAALKWIDSYGDHDGDGFVDYESTSHKGMDNQGWKDSGNSVRNRDGSLATPPIALVEVQGYVYRAKLSAAELYRHDGDDHRADRLEREASELRRRFGPAYWMEDRGTLAEALQKGGKQADAITSNPGQALWGGIVDPERAARIAQSLLGESMWSGWGIRTLAQGEKAYNPIDYQVGSIWPHDNAMIAAGLKRYGFDQESVQVFTGVYRAATQFSLYRLPEVFAGFSNKQYPRPVRYPVACNPQAWAAGSLPYLLQTVLGLEPDAVHAELRIVKPRLPSFLDDVTIRGLRVGLATVDLLYQRSGGATLVALLGREGDLNISVEY
jgi:glycogen debranching enzyme